MATSKKTSIKVEAQSKVLNAFDAYFASKKKAEEKVSPTVTAKKKSLRDESITKVCATCGKEYHPTRNGFAQVSKYCSQKCTMDKLRGQFTIN